MKPELYHAIDDADSAAARRTVVELGLVEEIRFRNVAYPEARAALEALGGSAVPALWDGATLAVGADAVIARVRAIAASRPPG